MKKRRIILVTEPRLLREMVERAIEKNPGLQIVAEVDNLNDLNQKIEETEADWVILFLQPGQAPPRQVKDLLSAFPSIRFLTIASDGSQVEMKWVEFHARALNRLSLEGLFTILNHDFPASNGGTSLDKSLGLRLLTDMHGIINSDR